MPTNCGGRTGSRGGRRSANDKRKREKRHGRDLLVSQGHPSTTFDAAPQRGRFAYVVVLFAGGGFEGCDPLLHLAAGVGAQHQGTERCDDLKRKRESITFSFFFIIDKQPGLVAM